MTGRLKGKVAEARACVFRHAGLVAVAKSAGLSLKWHRLQSVFESIHRLKSVPLVESYDKAPDVLRRESFSRVRGQSYALRLAFLYFSVSSVVRSNLPQRTQRRTSNVHESDYHEIRRHVRRRRERLSQRRGHRSS